MGTDGQSQLAQPHNGSYCGVAGQQCRYLRESRNLHWDVLFCKKKMQKFPMKLLFCFLSIIINRMLH